MALGVIASVGNLRGSFQPPERAELLRWTLESDERMEVANPGAIAFMKRFPPPPDARQGESHGEVTYITKSVFGIEGGPPMDGG